MGGTAVPLSAVCGSLSYFSPLLFTKTVNVLKPGKRKKSSKYREPVTQRSTLTKKLSCDLKIEKKNLVKMACLKVLKEEIRGLEATFPRVHPRLQIVSASVDELTCKFVDPAMRKHTIHANITETYPSTPPVWFSESDNVNVTNALTSLSETSGINNHLCYQVKSLLRQLCTLFSLPLPVECTDSDSNSSGCSTASSLTPPRSDSSSIASKAKESSDTSDSDQDMGGRIK